ncbi:MAG: hypothetical protein ABIJ12_03180 [bacterium]
MIDRSNIMHAFGVMVSIAIALIMTEKFGLRIEGWVVAAMLMSLSAFFSYVPKEKRKMGRALLGMIFSAVVVAVLFLAVDKWNL